MGFLRTLVNAAVGAAVPLEISGKALLKQTCKGYGVDVGRIPENARDQIVAQCIERGKMMASISNLPGMQDKKNWKVNCVDALEATAVMISEALDPKSRSALAHGETRDLLVRHGVLRE